VTIESKVSQFVIFHERYWGQEQVGGVCITYEGYDSCTQSRRRAISKEETVLEGLDTAGRLNVFWDVSHVVGSKFTNVPENHPAPSSGSKRKLSKKPARSRGQKSSGILLFWRVGAGT
jgi:hypothetical protein